jgi:hypothetical protein
MRITTTHPPGTQHGELMSELTGADTSANSAISVDVPICLEAFERGGMVLAVLVVFIPQLRSRGVACRSHLTFD